MATRHNTLSTGLRALAAATWDELRDPGMWVDIIGSFAVTGGIAFLAFTITVALGG